MIEPAGNAATGGRDSPRSALAWRFVAEGIGRAAAFLTMPLLARLVGADGYGEFTLAQASVAALVPVASLGLGFSLVRRLAGTLEPAEMATRLAAALALASIAVLPAAALLWLAAPVLSEVLADGAGAMTATLRTSAALLVAATWNGLVMEALRARQMSRASTLLLIAESVGLPAAIALLYGVDRLNPATVIAALAALRLATAALALAHLRRHGVLGRPRAPVLAAGEAVAVLAIGLPFMATGLGEWLMALGDRMTIGAIAGVETAGRFAAAQVLAMILASWGAPLWWLLFPRLSAALADGNRDGAMAVARQASGQFATGAVALFAVLAICGGELLVVLAGPAMRVPHEVTGLLAAAVFVNQAATPCEYALYAEHRGVVLMRATLLWGAIAVTLVVVLMPHLGLAGAALATLVGRLGFAASVYRAAGAIGFAHSMVPARAALQRIAVASVVGVLAAAAGLGAAAPLAATLGVVVAPVYFAAAAFVVAYGATTVLAIHLQRAHA